MPLDQDRSGVESPARQERGRLVFAAALWIFCGAVLLISFLRLFYGVDFVDEATYVAVPYRFCLGDTPFVDEHTPIQTSALLVLPFVELFHAIRGSSDGLVLFMRVLYGVFCCGVASVVASGIKPLIGLRSALLVSLACVAFCPIGIPNLSYNTLSIGFFTIGIFVGLQTLVWNRGSRWLFVAGVAHGFATVALPSYVLPNLCFAGGVWCLMSAHRGRAVLLYAAGGVTACALFAPWLFRFDRETLSNAYFHVHTSEGWASRVRQFIDQAWVFVPIKWELALALGAVWVGIKYRLAWLSAIVLALLPLFPLLMRRSTSSVWYVAMIAGCATVFLLLSWRTSLSKRLVLSIWVPSLCAGGIASLTSLNGLVNAGCGLFPIALAGMTLAVVLVREVVSGSASIVLRRLDCAFPIIVVAALVAYQHRPFGENPVRDLDTRVDFGPYKGMFTTPKKYAYLRAITADLHEVAQDHGRLLFVDHFPAGYLITHTRPGAGCIWTYPCTGGPRDDCVREMRANIARQENADLVIVRMHTFPVRVDNQWTSSRDEIDGVIEERFQPVIDRTGYTIFVPK